MVEARNVQLEGGLAYVEQQELLRPLLDEGRTGAFSQQSEVALSPSGGARITSTGPDGNATVETKAEISSSRTWGWTSVGNTSTLKITAVDDKNQPLGTATHDSTKTYNLLSEPDHEIKGVVRDEDGDVVAEGEGECQINTDALSLCYGDLKDGDGDKIGKHRLITNRHQSPDDFYSFTDLWDAKGKYLGNLHRQVKLNDEKTAYAVSTKFSRDRGGD